MRPLCRRRSQVHSYNLPAGISPDLVLSPPQMRPSRCEGQMSFMKPGAAMAGPKGSAEVLPGVLAAFLTLLSCPEDETRRYVAPGSVSQCAAVVIASWLPVLS